MLKVNASCTSIVSTSDGNTMCHIPLLLLLFFINLFLFIFIFWLRWVFVAVRWLSLVAVSRGPLLAAVCRPLTAVASPAVEHGLQQLWLTGSRVQAQ